MGYKYSTRGAITVAVSDIIVPPEKPELLRKADERVHDIERKYRRGLMSEDERYANVIKTWNDTTSRPDAAACWKSCRIRTPST